MDPTTCCQRLMVAFAAVLALATLSMPVAAASYQCQRNDLQQRFEVQTDDPVTGLPCRVIFWRTPEVGEVLWQARHDRTFCVQRVEELRTRFVDQGWSCAEGPPSPAPAVVAAAVPAAARDAKTPARPPPAVEPAGQVHHCRQGDGLRQLRIGVGDATTGLPCEVLYRAAAGGPESVLWTARNDPDFCVAKATEILALWATQGWRCQAGQSAPAPVEPALDRPEAVAGNTTRAATPSDELPETPPRLAPIAAEVPARSEASTFALRLLAVLEQDMATLEDLTDGRLEAVGGGYGDLDHDGLPDAVVLAQYESPRPLSRLLMMAYLFDGERYRLGDVEVLDGVWQQGQEVEIAPIKKGVVSLQLQGRAAAGAECCGWPDGTMAFVLDGRELTRTEAPVAAIEEPAPRR